MNDQDKISQQRPELTPSGRTPSTFRSGIILPHWLFWLLLVVLGASVALTLYSFYGSNARVDRIKELEAENELLRESVILGADPMPLNYPYYRGGPSAGKKGAAIDLKLAEKLAVMDARIQDIASNLGGEISVEQITFSDHSDGVPRGDGIPSIYPTFGRFSDGWGLRFHPITYMLEFHTGLDIANAAGTPVYATADGVVRSAGYDGGYGKRIIIRHVQGVESLYGHLYNFQVRAGDRVRKGQIIGLMGNTGLSTGPHLHYAITRNGVPLNPSNFLNRIDTDKFAGR